MSDKILYGLSNVYYAVATIGSDNTATFDTPVAIPGAVNLSMSPNGENTPFYADNIEYYTVNGNQGYDGTLEVARFPDSFKADVLNMIESANGLLAEDAAAEVVHFALLFQFEGDVSGRRFVLYNCTAGRLGDQSQTRGENIEPGTQTVDIKARPLHFAALDKDIVKAETSDATDSTVYNGWFTAVTVPTAQTVTT